MEKVIVGEIQITLVRPVNGLVAFCTCTVHNSFYVGNIAIYTAPSNLLGYRLVFPTKKLLSGKQVPIFYPYRKDVEEIVTKAIVGKYVELMESFNHIE